MMFQASNLKGNQFWIFWIIITTLLNHLTLKEDCSLKLLVIRTLYACRPQELSQIMLLLANIDLDFSQGRNSSVLVDNICYKMRVWTDFRIR